jgi:hypothetical protein
MLDRFNLNAYSLFGSEESLVEDNGAAGGAGLKYANVIGLVAASRTRRLVKEAHGDPGVRVAAGPVDRQRRAPFEYVGLLQGRLKLDIGIDLERSLKRADIRPAGGRHSERPRLDGAAGKRGLVGRKSA